VPSEGNIAIVRQFICSHYCSGHEIITNEVLWIFVLIVASKTIMGSRLPPTNSTVNENCDQSNGDEPPSAELAGYKYDFTHEFV
jgi:hypothetical protein